MPAGAIVVEGQRHSDRVQAPAAMALVREALVHVHPIRTELDAQVTDPDRRRGGCIPSVGGELLAVDYPEALVAGGQRAIEECVRDLVGRITSEPPQSAFVEHARDGETVGGGA